MIVERNCCFFHLLCCLVVGDAVMVRRDDAAEDGTVDKEKSNRLSHNRTPFSIDIHS